MTSVRVNDRDITIERFTLTKAMRVITLIGVIEKAMPSINSELAIYRKQYGEDNAQVLSRTQAALRYGPEPVYDDDGTIMLQDGQPVVMPSPLDRMTEKDWEVSNHEIRFKPKPSAAEQWLAVFPKAYEQAEKPVTRLLAVVCMKNSDFAKYVDSQTWEDEADRFVREVLEPAYFDEIMELAVVIGEQLEGQVLTKARSLGARVGKLRARIGMGSQTPTETPQKPETSQTSSGPVEKPNTEPVTASGPDTSGQTPSPSDSSPTTPSADIETSRTATVS